MNSALAMSNGKGPTSQIASAHLTVALYEWRFRRAHNRVKTAQVTKGRGVYHAIAFISPSRMGVPPDFRILVISLVEPIAHEQPIGQRCH